MNEDHITADAGTELKSWLMGARDQSIFRALFDLAAYILAFTAFFSLDRNFRAFFSELGGFSQGEMAPDKFSILWAVGLTAAGFVLPLALRRLWWLITILTAEAGYIVSICLYRLTGTMFSFAAVAYAEDGARFFSLKYLNMKPEEWAAAAFSLALMLLAIALTGKSLSRRAELARSLACLLLVILIGVRIDLLHRQIYKGHTTQSITWAAHASAERGYRDAYSDLDKINDAVMANGLYQYLFRSGMQAIHPDEWTLPAVHAELDEYYNSVEKESDSPYKGLLKGQNLIMIMLESCDSWFVTPEYMPNIYSLMQESKSFSNFYAPLFIPAATFNTEFTANTGLLAPTGGIANEAYTETYFPFALARLFREKDYTVNSYHGADGAIYNRANIHKAFGYSEYRDLYAIGMSENFRRDSLLNNGYWRFANGDEQPFFSFIITYSGHGPYNEEHASVSEPHLEAAEKAIDWDQVPYETEAQKDEFLHAVAQLMETDAFIGGLLQRMESDGRAEDTTLVIFADHYCKYITDTDFEMRLKHTDNRDLLTRVPFMIWSKRLEAEEIATAVSTADIAPTLVSLFDLDAEARWYVGNDMFSSAAGLAVLGEGHWTDGSVYFDGNSYWDVSDYLPYAGLKEQGKDYLFKLKPLSAEASDSAREKTAEASRRIDIAWKTFRSDYFKYLRDK
jgi:hypothetical protein